MSDIKYYCKNKKCKNGGCCYNAIYAPKGLVFMRDYETTGMCLEPMVAKRKFIHFICASGSSIGELERIYQDWLRDIKIVSFQPESKRKNRYIIVNYKTDAIIDDANGKGFSSWKKAIDTYIKKCNRGEYGVQYEVPCKI